MYKHFIRFNRINEIFEIAEPFGFDKATFKIKKERHARNLIIADFDEVELHKTLNHQFDLVATEIQLYGWETSIDYILQKNNIDFKIGQVDGATSILYKDKVKIQITQDTLTTYIKRNENIEIDAFSDKDLKGNTIGPCQTTDLYLKPKPVNQKSEYGQKILGGYDMDAFQSAVMPVVNNLVNFGVENSFSPFDFLPSILTDFNPQQHSNRLLTAKNTLQNVKVKVKNLNLNGIRTGANTGSFYLQLKRYFYDDSNNNINTIQDIDLIPLTNLPNPTAGGSLNFNNLNFDIDIPLIQAGESLWVNFRFTNQTIFDSYSCEGVEITGTSTAIGSVIKAIRLKDYIKHKIETLGGVYNDTVFNTPLYNDNFVANGRMIGGFDDLPFHATFKNTLETFTDEAFADYEITDTNVNIKTVNEFYLSDESELLNIAPEHLHSIKANEKLMLNTIEIGFKKSSKDRTGNNQNTTDAVHTQAQYRLETEKVENVKKLDFEHIRDAFLIEEQRRKANIIEEKTISLENDENVFCIDAVPTPPAFEISFVRFLRFSVEVPSQIQIILSDGTFKWTNLGMVVGQIINEGLASVQITEITDYQLKVVRLNNFYSQTSQVQTSVLIRYTLQGVPYINRTNEGFSLIEGVDNSENYSNLNFSLKRIFNRHLDWWLNAGQFIVGKKINVQKIAINDKLETQLTGQDLVIDNAPFEIVDGGFMSGFNLNCKVFSDFETAQNITNNRNKFISIKIKEGVILNGWLIDFQYNFRTNTTMIDVNLTKESFLLGLPYILAKDL
jgi:hypothetical protein